MKNYEEMAESVFQRSGEIIARRNKNRKAMVKVVFSMSCFCLVALLGLGIFQSGIFNPSTSQSSGNQGEDIEDNEKVYYSKLIGNTDTVNKDILEGFSVNSADIVAFDELSLDDCHAIVEGKITNMYLKEYSFTTSDDKFGEDWIMTNKRSTIVYEIMVDKVWYGNEEQGKIITVEDELFYTDKIFSMKIGHSYVVPICNAGNEIFTTSGEILSGDLQRESIYGTIYPFHPQIEVTDRGYIVTTDWKTLMEGEKKQIIMDVDLSQQESFYKDKMMLIPKDVFTTQMGILIEKMG